MPRGSSDPAPPTASPTRRSGSTTPRRSTLAGLSQAPYDRQLAVPANAGEMRGSRKWWDFIRAYIREKAPEPGRDRDRLVKDALGQMGYATFTFRSNPRVVKFLKEKMKVLKDRGDTILPSNW